MTKPTYLATTLALCERVEAHDRKMTPGPLLVEKRDDDYGGIDYPVYAADGDVCICFEHDEDAARARRDAEGIASYRTDAPALAARLRVVMTIWPAALRFIEARQGDAASPMSPTEAALLDELRAATAKLEAMS